MSFGSSFPPVGVVVDEEEEEPTARNEVLLGSNFWGVFTIGIGSPEGLLLEGEPLELGLTAVEDWLI